MTVPVHDTPPSGPTFPQRIALEGSLAHHFANLEQQRETEALGMWVYIATEVLIFAALFASYFAYRILYQPDFEAASSRLNLLIGGINTLVLLASSFTMVLSIHAARVNKQKSIVLFLSLTVILGLTFLGLKVVEYASDYEDNLVPNSAYFQPHEWVEKDVNPDHVQLFLVFYYVLTGVHAVHMIVGIGWLGVLIALAWVGRFGPAHYMPLEILGLYWHFVDIVWIFLLPMLYLTGRHEISDLHFLTPPR